MRRSRQLWVLVLLVVIMPLAMAATPAVAGLELVRTSVKAKSATTVTWTSSFRDLDYALGSEIVVPVSWTVDAGAAEFSGFALKRFTPRSRKDPASGTLEEVTLIQDSDDPANPVGRVDATVVFDGLHLDKRRNVEIGNVHLKLFLKIDRDGDGVPESRVGYGVNVHVEDPQ